MTERDQHDEQADKLFDMVRDAKPDKVVVRAIAKALRCAARQAWTDGMGVGYKAGMEPLWITPENPHRKQ
jgi:hypothetical protein